MVTVAGLDIGSTVTKALIFGEDKILGFSLKYSGVDPEKTVNQVLDAALEKSGKKREDLKYIVSTGYGRKAVSFANDALNEINANARGALWLGSSAGTVRTIIDIGGQDSKVLALNEDGTIKDFAMNDKCAAGTGRFLEVVARVLEVDVKDMGALSLKSTAPIEINNTCAVFAESEIISLIARKKKKEDIIAGTHRSIARRIMKLAKRVGIQPVVFFDGGPAKNAGLVKALEEELGMPLFVPSKPQIIIALGAALTAYDKVKGTA